MKMVRHETVGEERITCIFGGFYKVRNLGTFGAIQDALRCAKRVEEIVSEDRSKSLVILVVKEDILFVSTAIVDMVIITRIKLS